MAAYLHRATITGRGAFPLDMLRYDCCFPSHSTDVSQIAESCDPEMQPMTWRVELLRITGDKRRNPWTVDRWKSFGCTITVGATEKIQ